jgi:hypothetical protein
MKTRDDMNISGMKTLGAIFLITLVVVGICAFGVGLLLLQHDKLGQTEKMLEHILAMVAILYGIIAVLYEWRLHRAFESQEKDIKDIVLSVHTRYLGEWPGHLRNITNLIATSAENDEILISVDFLAYGTISVPEEYEKYFSAIKGARIRKSRVRIIIHGLELAKRSFDKQFGQYRDPQKFQELKPKLIRLRERYKNILASVPEDYDKFFQAVLLVQNALSEELIVPVDDPAEIATNSAPTSPDSLLGEGVFYWLVRKSGRPAAMIFAYPKFVGFGKGYGFETRDDRLMEVFASQFEDKWTAARVIKRGESPFSIAAAADNKS